MTRIVDTDLINARVREREQIVQDGRFIESIESMGKTPEELKAEAKKVLGLDEDGIIQLEYQNKLKEQNLQTKAFISLANFTSKVEGTGILTDEEFNSVKDIEAKMALIICEKYGIDEDELYVVNLEGGL